MDILNGLAGVEIQREGDLIYVRSDYNPKFVEKARQLNGQFRKYKGKAWEFNIREEERVKQALMEIYGEDGETEIKKLDVYVDLSKVDNNSDSLYMLGRQLLHTWGMYKKVDLGEDVTIESGSVKSGGSKDYPVVQWEDDTVLLVRGVPETAYKKEMETNPQAISLTKPVSKGGVQPIGETYQYMLTQRPPSIGTHPTDNITGEIEEINNPYRENRKAWLLQYSKPLSQKDIESFELTPVFSEAEVGKIYKEPFGRDFIVTTIKKLENSFFHIEREAAGKTIPDKITFKQYYYKYINNSNAELVDATPPVIPPENVKPDAEPTPQPTEQPTQNQNNTPNTQLTMQQQLEIIKTNTPIKGTGEKAELMNSLAEAIKTKTLDFTKPGNITSDAIDVSEILKRNDIPREKWEAVNGGSINFSEKEAVEYMVSLINGMKSKPKQPESTTDEDAEKAKRIRIAKAKMKMTKTKLELLKRK